MATETCIHILSFDFGMKHIGVAVGQSLTETATPLAALQAQNGIPNWQLIIELVNEWQVHACIVGLPLNMDGSEQHLTRCARKFANRLHEHTRRKVFTVDERLTSIEAKRQLQTHSEDHNSHSYCAKLIAEQWLRDQRQ